MIYIIRMKIKIKIKNLVLNMTDTLQVKN